MQRPLEHIEAELATALHEEATLLGERARLSKVIVEATTPDMSLLKRLDDVSTELASWRTKLRELQQERANHSTKE